LYNNQDENAMNNSFGNGYDAVANGSRDSHGDALCALGFSNYSSARGNFTLGTDTTGPVQSGTSYRAICEGINMSGYQDIMSFQRDTEALAQVAGRLGWDQETMMPSGAAEQRGEEMAAMEGVMHARRTDPRLADWLAQSAEEDLDDVARAQLRHIRQTYDRTC
jgi:hypothetical protein